MITKQINKFLHIVCCSIEVKLNFNFKIKNSNEIDFDKTRFF